MSLPTFTDQTSTHKKERRFQCGDCLKRFNSKENLMVHHLDVHSEKPFKCDQCGKRYGREAVLEKHLLIHSAKQFACKDCQRRFTYKRDLETHHLDVHAERKFKCDLCGKGFGRERSLQQHLVSHSEEKPFECEECQKSFVRKGQLKAHHLDSHAEKKFKCDYCGCAFGRVALLKKHLQVHLENERYSCDQCERSYKHKKGLRAHSAVHSTTQRKTSEQHSSAQGKQQKKVTLKVKRPCDSNGSSGAENRLRSRLRARLSKTPNYRVDEDSSDDSQSSGDRLSRMFEDDSDCEQSAGEWSESEKRSRKDETVSQSGLRNEEQNGGPANRDEIPTRRVKTENLVPDEEVYADLIEGSQKRIKRERDLDGQIELNERDIASPTIAFSSEGDPDGDPDGNPDGGRLSEFSFAATSPKFKVAVGVGYEAPIEDRTPFYCYDFNDLIRANQSRMKTE